MELALLRFATLELLAGSPYFISARTVQLPELLNIYTPEKVTLIAF